MKRIALLIASLFVSAIMIAAGHPKFDAALDAHDKGRYKEAKALFQECLDDPYFEKVKDNIILWIADCDRLQSQHIQRQNAAAERKKRRIENRCVFLSVKDASISKDPSQSTVSSLSGVLMKKELKICSSIDEAYTVVTAYTYIEPSTEKNGFFKAKGGGYVRYGKAMEDKLDGQWSIECEATSAVDMRDAERLVRNKLNFKLSCALFYLIDGIVPESSASLPNNSLALMLSPDTDESIMENNLRRFMQAIKSYIIKSNDYIFSDAMSDANSDELDKVAKKQAEVVEMDQRAPIHELDGFKLILVVNVSKESDQYFFEGSIKDFKGHVIQTARTGREFIIKDLSAENQEVAATIIATGLGLRQWTIGEIIGESKLASYDGLHGLLMMNTTFGPDSKWSDSGLKGYLGKINKLGWRYPFSDELEAMIEYKNKLGLRNKYWAGDSPKKGYSNVVDFQATGTSPVVFLAKETKKDYYTLFVKEF